MFCTVFFSNKPPQNTSCFELVISKWSVVSGFEVYFELRVSRRKRARQLKWPAIQTAPDLHKDNQWIRYYLLTGLRERSSSEPYANAHVAVSFLGLHLPQLWPLFFRNISFKNDIAYFINVSSSLFTSTKLNFSFINNITQIYLFIYLFRFL